MTAPTIAPAHAANMAAKALRFALFFRSHGAGLDDPEAVAWMSDQRWTEATALINEAHGAAETVPSPPTRAAVVSLLRTLAETDDADPFAFPKGTF